MRIDVLSRMSFKSGTLILIQIEDLKRLIDKKINKKIDEYEIICDVVENGGEMVGMDPYENVSIGKMYTLDEDGGNSTILRVGPVINKSRRLLNTGEKTAQEYCIYKKNKENIDMSEIGDFFMKELENYKKEML
jgi:hypothetical protein